MAGEQTGRTNKKAVVETGSAEIGVVRIPERLVDGAARLGHADNWAVRLALVYPRCSLAVCRLSLFAALFEAGTGRNRQRTGRRRGIST